MVKKCHKVTYGIMKNDICVIIRVYNRIEDLNTNLEIIKQTWSNNKYYILVSTNGEKDGYYLNNSIKEKADQIVNTVENVGHIKGNSQLLQQAIPYIPEECEYTLLLEADTWLYGDQLISKYILKMEQTGAVWASAKWYDRFFSLATDFALVSTQYLKQHADIVDFGNYPEPHVANYLMDRNERFIYIKENMPVMVPSYVKKWFMAPKGRFFVFPKSKMVTHHIELYPNGMRRKEMDFNALSNNFLPNNIVRFPFFRKLQMWLGVYTSYIFVRRSWYSKVTRFDSSIIK